VTSIFGAAFNDMSNLPCSQNRQTKWYSNIENEHKVPTTISMMLYTSPKMFQGCPPVYVLRGEEVLMMPEAKGLLRWSNASRMHATPRY